MTGNDYPSRAELYGLETAEVPSPASLSSMLGCAAAVAAWAPRRLPFDCWALARSARRFRPLAYGGNAQRTATIA